MNDEKRVGRLVRENKFARIYELVGTEKQLYVPKQADEVTELVINPTSVMEQPK